MYCCAGEDDLDMSKMNVCGKKHFFHRECLEEKWSQTGEMSLHPDFWNCPACANIEVNRKNIKIMRIFLLTKNIFTLFLTPTKNYCYGKIS